MIPVRLDPTNIFIHFATDSAVAVVGDESVRPLGIPKIIRNATRKSTVATVLWALTQTNFDPFV